MKNYTNRPSRKFNPNWLSSSTKGTEEDDFPCNPGFIAEDDPSMPHEFTLMEMKDWVDNGSRL